LMKRILLAADKISALLCLLILLIAANVVAGADLPGHWQIRAAMPSARTEVAAAELGGRIYVIGGYEQGGRLIEEYNPATDSWRGRAPLPKPLHHVGAAAINGKIYVIGGASVHPGQKIVGLSAQVPHRALGTNEMYDPATNTWTSGPPLPTPRSGLSYTYYKGMILVLGGELPPEMRTFTENEGFDVKANAWRTLAPMPEGRHATAAATVGDHVYLSGGSLKPGSGQVTNQMIEFTLP